MITRVDYSQAITLYQPTLHAIAMRLLRCRADAEDVVQDTFVKWLNAEHEKIQNTKAYLITAVTNNCINHLNSIRRKKEEYIENFHWPEFVERFRDAEFPDLEQRVNRALQVVHLKLEPLERAVYLLKEVFDFDYQSLQEVLDKKQEHCRQLLCRARKKIEEERDNFQASLPQKKAAFMESFHKACDFDNAAELVNQLRQDISRALSKKFEK